MRLEYAGKILDHLGMYNFIYGPFSTSYAVQDSLFCAYYFIWIKDDSEKNVQHESCRGLVNIGTEKISLILDR